MVSRAVRIAYLLVAPIAIVIAVLMQWSVDQEITSAERPIIVTVRGNTGSASAEFYQAVSGFSSAHQVSVGKLVAQLGGDATRQLYLTQGVWLRDGYPSFDPGYSTEVRPFSDLDLQHPSGTYLVYDQWSTAENLAKTIQAQGYDTVVDPALTGSRLLLGSDTALMACLGVLVVLLLVVISGEFSSAKRYGVMRMSGIGLPGILAKEYAEIIRHLALSLAAFAVVTVIGLFWFNGLAQVGDAALTAAILCGLGFAAVVVAHVCCAILIFLLVDLLDGIKGELKGVPVIPLYYAVRLPLVVLIITTAGQAVVAFHGVHRADIERPLWEASADLGRIEFSTHRIGSAKDHQILDETVGSWMSRQEISGKVIVSGTEHILGRNGDLISQVLFVNPAYLERHPVRLVNGETLRADQDSMTIAIPSTRESISTDITNWVKDFLTHNARPAKPLDSRSVQLAPGQKLFGYGSSPAQKADGQSYKNAQLTDPVVVLLPTGTLPGSAMVSFSTSGGVLFTNRESLEQELQNQPVVKQFVGSINSAASPFAEQYAKLVSRSQRLGLLVALLLIPLAATGFGLASTYRNIHRQAARVKYLMGWSFPRIFTRVAIFEALGWLVVLGFFLRYSLRISKEGASGNILSGRDPEYLLTLGFWMPWIAVSLFTVTLGLLVASMMTVARKIQHGQ